MSRIRTIKPGFFLDDELSELPVLTRLLFIGLWTLADSEGRLEDRPKKIRAQLHPYDDGDTEAMLQALHNGRFITRYTVNGKNYLEIRTFTKHQRLSSKEADEKSAIPAPPSMPPITEQIVSAEMRTIPIVHHQDAPGTQPERIGDAPGITGREGNKEGKGREGKGRERIAPARNTPAPKTGFPSDFTLTAAIRAWADERGFADLERHLDHFRDKALANGYRYADWSAAFKTAVRDDWAKLRTPQPTPTQTRKPFTAHERHAALHNGNSAAIADWIAVPHETVVTVIPAAPGRAIAHECH